MKQKKRRKIRLWYLSQMERRETAKRGRERALEVGLVSEMGTSGEESMSMTSWLD